MLKKITRKISKFFVKNDIYSKITFIKNNIDVLSNIYNKKSVNIEALLTNVDICTSIDTLEFIFKYNFNADVIRSDRPTNHAVVPINRWFTDNGRMLEDYSIQLTKWLDLVYHLNDRIDILEANRDPRVSNVIFFKNNINATILLIFNIIMEEI